MKRLAQCLAVLAAILVASPATLSSFKENMTDQAATQLWYHDHALGATRINNYAGLSGV